MTPSDWPIIFSAPMVRAILEGRKTATRRLSKQWLKRKQGDQLWVRECYGIGGARLVDPCLNFRADGGQKPIHILRGTRHAQAFSNRPFYSSELMKIRDGWIPSIHMPRWASRIQLELTEDARLERLQDIAEQEAMNEGFYQAVHDSPDGIGQDVIGWFAGIWKTLHTEPGERWDDNPEIVRIAFRRIE